MSKYDEIISAFGINYLEGTVSKVQVAGKFCLVDNIEKDGGMHRADFTAVRKLRFPIKISLGFCLYCKSGTATLRVQQRDYRIGNNGVLVVFAGQILEKVTLSKGCRLIFAALDSEYIMTGIRGPHGKNLRQMLLHSHEPIITGVAEEEGENFEQLCHAVKNIVANCDGETADGILSGFSYIFASLLLKWTRQWNNRMAGQKTTETHCKTSFSSDSLSMPMNREQEVLLRFEEDLHNFSRKDRSVGFYARRQCLSEKHFSRMVKKASGRKPMDIIREYVILDAKSLLLTGLYSVKEIAEKLGFINNSFFSRYFRLSTTQTPLEFLRGSEE